MLDEDGMGFQKVLDVLEVEEVMICAKHRDL
jgi:hypothetical protein